MEKRVQQNNASNQCVEHWEDFELMRQYQAQCIERAKSKIHGESLNLEDFEVSTQEENF